MSAGLSQRESTQVNYFGLPPHSSTRYARPAAGRPARIAFHAPRIVLRTRFVLLDLSFRANKKGGCGRSEAVVSASTRRRSFRRASAPLVRPVGGRARRRTELRRTCFTRTRAGVWRGGRPALITNTVAVEGKRVEGLGVAASMGSPPSRSLGGGARVRADASAAGPRPRRWFADRWRGASGARGGGSAWRRA